MQCLSPVGVLLTKGGAIHCADCSIHCTTFHVPGTQALKARTPLFLVTARNTTAFSDVL